MILNNYISTNTHNALMEAKKQAICKYSKYYNVDKQLIIAIINQESNNNFFAVRIEKHLKKAGWYKRTLQGIDQVTDFHYCSFGLMQIMFGNARHLGFPGTAFELFNPDENIKYSVKFLRQLFRRYNNMADVISAYNQGNNRYYDINKNGIKDNNEKFRNQDYVDKVLEFYYNT